MIDQLFSVNRIHTRSSAIFAEEQYNFSQNHNLKKLVCMRLTVVLLYLQYLSASEDCNISLNISGPFCRQLIGKEFTSPWI